MGNQQTTRRVTFEREQAGLIAISDSVAKRLQASVSTLHHRDASDEPVKSREPQSSSLATSEIPSSAIQKPQVSSSATASPSETTDEQHQYFYVQQLNSQDEYSKAMAKLEEQWQERYKRLEGDSDRVKHVSAEEFNRAVKQVEAQFASKSYAVVNLEAQKALMDCYKENTTRSLKCSREAESFIKSVEDYKLGFLSKHIS